MLKVSSLWDAFLVGERSAFIGLSDPQNRWPFIEQAPAVEIVFLKRLILECCTQFAESRRQLDKPFLVDAVFFFDLNGHWAASIVENKVCGGNNLDILCAVRRYFTKWSGFTVGEFTVSRSRFFQVDDRAEQPLNL